MTQPGSSSTPVIDNTIGSSVVSNYSEAFDLAALLGEADAEAFGGLATSDETKLGKSVPAPPARRYAEDEGKIQEDEEPEIGTDSNADLSHATTSTLGKRQRDEFDSEDDEDEEEEVAEEVDSDEETDTLLGGNSAGAWEARAISKNLTAASSLVQPKKKTTLPVSQKSESSPIIPPITSKDEPEWLERQRAKASLPSKRNQMELNRKGKLDELSTIFSEEELKSLAPSRGNSRKKAKKQKRREEKSGAGLVNILETAMDLKKAKKSGGDVEVPQVKRKGLFDLLDQSGGGKEVDEDEEL